MNGYRKGGRPKNILANFVVRTRREKEEKKDHKIKKILANFVAWPSVFQMSSCSKVYTSARISAISCPHASFVALFHLYSAWCICLASSTYAFLYAPVCSPPPGAVPAPQRTMTIITAIGDRGSKGGRVGELKSRDEN